MSRSVQLNQTLRRVAAWLLTATLLFPVIAAPIYATQEPGEPSVSDEDSLPVWNGGAAASYEGSGTQSDPYRISSGEELALLAQKVREGETFAGKYFKVTEDIFLNATTNHTAWSDAPPARRWIPIGGYATVHIGSADDYDRLVADSTALMVKTEDGFKPANGYQSGVIYYRLTVFSGTFDGDGHTISGLYSTARSDYQALFGACRDATLRNIKLTELYIEGENRVGGLVGALHAHRTATVEHCSVNGTVSGKDTVGGMIGYTDIAADGKLLVNNCEFSGKLTASSAAGGILGGSGTDLGALQLTGCANNGQINAKSFAGGIVGRLSGNNHQLSGCKNSGAIRADSDLGGIVGLIDGSDGILTLSNCQNGGTLLGADSVGGIIGRVALDGEYATLELLSNRNVGDLIGRSSVGGILGSCKLAGGESQLNLSGNKNSSPVRGDEQIGGIVGGATVEAGSLSVGACENYGAITASRRFAGGILGYGKSTAQLSIYECSARATVTAGNSYSGGIAGYLLATDGNLQVERSSAGGYVTALSAASDDPNDGICGSIVGGMTAENPSATAKIQNCLGAATLSAKGASGGIAGQLTAEKGQCRVSSSLFSGAITTGCKLSGGIAAIVTAKSEQAATTITDCYYDQSTSSRAMFPAEGEGTVACMTTEALLAADLRNPERLSGLDFSVWQAPSENEPHPTLQAVPFVWTEYQYTVTRDGAMLDAYVGRSDVVTIPEKLGGVAVTIISPEAFEQSGVIRLTMPDSVTVIGEAAFAGSTYLERVTLSAKLLSIGARAFQGCTALKELRCTNTPSTLQTGAENDPFFAARPFIHPITLQIAHHYEDGSAAGKNTSLTVYEGDYYEIKPLEIEGYEADLSTVEGICTQEYRVSVIYRIGTYHLSIRYLYPDGSEAFPSFEDDFQFGQSYRIDTPSLQGYTADYLFKEGTMPGEDTVLTVYFSENFAEQTESENSTLKIAILILSGLVTVSCLGYFIFRYRSSAESIHSDN